MEYKLIRNNLSNSDIRYYEEANPGYTVETDKLLQTTNKEGSTVYIIFKGPFTKPYMCRDCGSYYELSLGNSDLKICKSEIKI